MIVSCTLRLESDSQSVDEKARVVQSFFKFIRHELGNIPEWDFEDVDTLTDLIEDFLMLKFYEKYYSLYYHHHFLQTFYEPAV